MERPSVINTHFRQQNFPPPPFFFLKLSRAIFDSFLGFLCLLVILQSGARTFNCNAVVAFVFHPAAISSLLCNTKSLLKKRGWICYLHCKDCSLFNQVCNCLGIWKLPFALCPAASEIRSPGFDGFLAYRK